MSVNREFCPFCHAAVPALNLAGTRFHCPDCDEAWVIVPSSEEEIGDDEDE